MKKKMLLVPLIITAVVAPVIANQVAEVKEVKAISGPVATSLSSKQNIYLKDNSDEEIRDYYKDLNSLSETERKGTNILKNLKPILQNFNYYNYDAVWKIYEITDREWELSPASGTEYGTYDATTNTIIDYQYGKDNNDGRNNPYVHTLYRNRDENGVTIESGRIREWGDHSQTGGTNREHVWCQSRGFKAPGSGAEGPAGTDIHHLMSGDGYVNGKPHNNNPYGYVDPNNITIDSKTSYSYCEGNIAGAPLHPHTEDESAVVFEPQDSDKGDIARACFYMVACYNNLSGKETITQYNPNLTLADYATDSGKSEISSADHPVAMGILSDLLEWHRLDPVDEYEIHRNNLIYNNYQHNRNPFIDFPEWVEYIWGEQKDIKAINPQTDIINGNSFTGVRLSTKSVSVNINSSIDISATSSDNSNIFWSISDNSIISISKNTSTSGEKITIKGLKEGKANLTASVVIEGETYTSECEIIVKAKEPFPILYFVIGGAALLVIIIIIFSVPALRKKAKKQVKKQVKKQTRSYNSKSKKKY